MKKLLKWGGIVLGILVLIGMLLPKHPVDLTLDATLRGTELVILGTTSLPDGALISYEVTRPPEMKPLPEKAKVIAEMEERNKSFTPEEREVFQAARASRTAEDVARDGREHNDLWEMSDGFAEVKGGRFSATIPVENWQPGRIEVWVAFQTLLGTETKQPDSVIEEFGEMGEKLTGSNVTKTGNLKRVELAATVER